MAMFDWSIVICMFMASNYCFGVYFSIMNLWPSICLISDSMMKVFVFSEMSTSSSTGTDNLYPRQIGRSVKLITQLHVVPNLRMRGAVPSFRVQKQICLHLLRSVTVE
jgi:hypothetical protein